VATRGGGASEIIDDGETGLLVSRGSPKELGIAIARIIASQVNVPAMVAKAHREARERFGLAQRVADVNAVIAALALSRVTVSERPDRERAISDDPSITIH
jgi:glycosyltransferase involved in cell wall biosynthesis